MSERETIPAYRDPKRAKQRLGKSEWRELQGRCVCYGAPCKQCGERTTFDPELHDVVLDVPTGPDPCIGRLPGVTAACCGHGGPGYIYFENGVHISFDNVEVLRIGDGTSCYGKRKEPAA